MSKRERERDQQKERERERKREREKERESDKKRHKTSYLIFISFNTHSTMTVISGLKRINQITC